MTEKEDYAIILDYLPYGYPMGKRMTPIAQAIGEKNLSLLELVPRRGVAHWTGRTCYRLALWEADILSEGHGCRPCCGWFGKPRGTGRPNGALLKAMCFKSTTVCAHAVVIGPPAAGIL